MKGQIKTINLSQLPREHNEITTLINIEYLISGPLTAVFFDDLNGNIQRAHR